MPPDDKEKLNRLEELKSKLWSKDFPTKVEHRDSFTPARHLDVPESWERGTPAPEPGQSFKKSKFFKKFFFFSLAFFILALIYGGYSFFSDKNTVSAKNIDISVLGNTFSAGGEELPLTIDVANRNSVDLELVDLIVEYPKSADLSGETERIRETLGDIPAGASRSANVKPVLFGEQGSVRSIRISIEYRVENSNSFFKKERIYDVTINSTPVDLVVSAPEEASPNQNFSLTVKAIDNASKPVIGLLLRVDYPTGFQFSSATPAPSFGNNVWAIGDLSPGADSSVTISGKMLDVFDGEEKTFRVSGGLESARTRGVIETIFNTISHRVAIKKALIEARLYINGVYSGEYASSSRTPIEGEIRWANNLETKVNDLVIRAKLSGNALDRKTIYSPKGFYNSLDDTITWDKNSERDFAEVGPGAVGSVPFSLSSVSLFGASKGVLSQPSIDIEVSISGRQPLETYDAKEVSNKESKTVRISSDVGFAAKALFLSGPFTNRGSVPPKVERETTYTITWSLSNTSNNISKAQLRSSLPSWVKFLGPISPKDSDLTYNTQTREVVWNVGNIPKGAGISAGAVSISFQVGFTPSLSQVGTAPTIVNESVLTGHDDFANVDVRLQKGTLTTRLVGDSSFPPGGDIVSE
ncbi:MAG: hypothetical protein AAB500_00155 [Patescibacteria group bacterium]